MSKIVVLYTRYEKNTGGDQALLLNLLPSLIQKLPDESKVIVLLAYDNASVERVKRTEEQLPEMVHKINPNITVQLWCFKYKKSPQLSRTVQASNLDFDFMDNKPYEGKPIKRAHKNTDIFKRLCGLTEKANTFVVAGWSHLLTPDCSKHLTTQLNISIFCRVLACAIPGRGINECGFITGLIHYGHREAYAMQLGTRTPNGLIVNFDAMQPDNIAARYPRETWEGMLLAQKPSLANFIGDGRPKSDNLAVIYCSKDGPEPHGLAFLNKVAAEATEILKVVLVGSVNGSAEQQAWIEAIQLTLYNNPVLITRTTCSSVLMRGLRDAKFSMATGAFSILEARSLEHMEHVTYLAPKHMTQLAQMLEMEPNEVSRAFSNGRKTLTLLQDITCSGELSFQCYEHFRAKTALGARRKKHFGDEHWAFFAKRHHPTLSPIPEEQEEDAQCERDQDSERQPGIS